MEFLRIPVYPVIALVLCSLVACDSTSSQEDFLKDATSPPSGFSQTDETGQVISEDTDDWRTAPFFVGKVVVDPAFPNPAGSGQNVFIGIRILQFEDLTGRLTLSAQVGDDFRILDELLDTGSPGFRQFQFNSAQIGEPGLHRLFILDQFSEVVSYGDLLIE